jgi:YVTN family beta-propeller protein
MYVALVGEGDTAGLDEIDTATETLAKHIVTGFPTHNPYVTPDGRYLLAGSQPGKNVSVIDMETDKVAWTAQLDLGVRPMTMSVNPDGSTKWIFVQLTKFDGFSVVDFATHKEINRITNPPTAPGKKPVPGGGEYSHGMAVTKDQKTLLVCSRISSAVYFYSLPDLKLIGTADLGGKGPGWLSLSPDGKKAYIANSITNNVSVIDVASMKEIALIPVGYTPKRNTSGWLE